MTQHLSPEQLQKIVDKLPRIQMAHLPTPLEPMPRLTERLGGPSIWIKREDLTGLAYGGNKARHYEFEMPHVADEGYDVMINIMDYHSNNARMTAAAANKIGMRYVLVLKNAANRQVQGNLLVDKVLGAELHLLDEYQSGDAEGYATKLKEELEAEGHKPYLIQDHLFPRIVGMVGFVQAGIEMREQIEENDLKNVHIIGVAGRSLCGLIIAAKAMGLDWKFTGVTVNYDLPLGEYIFQHSNDIQELLDLPVTFEESDMRVLDQYVGEGYGVMTAQVADAIHIAAQTDAIICDPNYTGTTMAALIDQVEEGGFDDDETVIFLHTGGLPAVFTFAEQLANHKG
ncbi:MAG: pyridoxal-phosphate dependent enzyme [Dehalococcoidia bacterium]|jgi:1-aminocyclopropane-1-carboxylate deaminase/D-cysteine desulfhydrase-like pyridoxal-dependent ACC family enzyme|nr:pyridoxal-phosphate dependent enzyme [Dehalococcoidia bacterium]